MEVGVGNNKVRMDIDQILPLIGEYGRYQIYANVVFCMMNFPFSYHLLIMYFSTLHPNWKCVTNSSVCVFNGTFPRDDYRRCSMPRSAWEHTESKEYSIITQFDIHCDSDWLVSLIHCSFFIGWVTGSMIIGWLADKYGRKMIFFPSVSILLIVGICTAFMPNVYLIIVCRFVIGFFFTGTTLQLFIIISELVGNKYRAFAGQIIYSAGSVALCVLTLKAYLIKEWKLLNIVSNAPYLFILISYKALPESIRWLQQKGKTDEVMILIRRIAYWNKRKLASNIEISLPIHTSKSKVTPLDLFSTRKSTVSCLIQGFMWLAAVACFYSLALAADDLGGSPYRDQLILIAIEIPSIVFAVYFMNRVGRKPTGLTALLIGGACCVAIAFIPTLNSRLKIGRLVCGMVGKLAVTIALKTIYTWSVELFPTSLCGEGMAFMQITGHAGSASAPWIAKGMYSLGKGAPFITMGIPALIGAALGMVLEETNIKRPPIGKEEEKDRRSDVSVSKEIELRVVPEGKHAVHCE